MSNETPSSLTDSPKLPGDEHAEYLPEPFYFQEDPGFRRQYAARITARCLGQWATRFQAWPVGQPSFMREGLLPADADARAEVIDGLFDWIEDWLMNRQGPVAIGSIGLRLYDEERELLDQHDGVPLNRMWLTAEQFKALQDELEQRKLPRDIYYPRNAMRCVIEPAHVYGGVILGERCYSPLGWARRDVTSITQLQVPSEVERRKILFQECQHFGRTLTRRSLELREPGKDVDEQEMSIIRVLQHQLGDLIRKLVQDQRNVAFDEDREL